MTHVSNDSTTFSTTVDSTSVTMCSTVRAQRSVTVDNPPNRGSARSATTDAMDAFRTMSDSSRVSCSRTDRGRMPSPTSLTRVSNTEIADRRTDGFSSTDRSFSMSTRASVMSGFADDTYTDAADFMATDLTPGTVSLHRVRRAICAEDLKCNESVSKYGRTATMASPAKILQAAFSDVRSLRRNRERYRAGIPVDFRPLHATAILSQIDRLHSVLSGHRTAIRSISATSGSSTTIDGSVGALTIGFFPFFGFASGEEFASLGGVFSSESTSSASSPISSSPSPLSSPSSGEGTVDIPIRMRRRYATRSTSTPLPNDGTDATSGDSQLTLASLTACIALVGAASDAGALKSASVITKAGRSDRKI